MTFYLEWGRKKLRTFKKKELFYVFHFRERIKGTFFWLPKNTQQEKCVETDRRPDESELSAMLYLLSSFTSVRRLVGVVSVVSIHGNRTWPRPAPPETTQPIWPQDRHDHLSKVQGDKDILGTIFISVRESKRISWAPHMSNPVSSPGDSVWRGLTTGSNWSGDLGWYNGPEIRGQTLLTGGK